MRYFIFLLGVLCASCGLSNRHTTVQEKTDVMKDSIRAEAIHSEPVVKSGIVIDTVPGLASAAGVYVFDPSMIAISAYTGAHSWSYPNGEWYPLHITLAAPTGIYATVTDSISSTPASADTISTAPVKLIPKSTAAILPEPKSSAIPYIVCGIAAIFLSTLFFALTKRVRKAK